MVVPESEQGGKRRVLTVLVDRLTQAAAAKTVAASGSSQDVAGHSEGSGSDDRWPAAISVPSQRMLGPCSMQ